MGKKIIIKESQLKKIVKNIVTESGIDDYYLLKDKRFSLFTKQDSQDPQKDLIGQVWMFSNTGKDDVTKQGYIEFPIYYMSDLTDEMVKDPSKTPRRIRLDGTTKLIHWCKKPSFTLKKDRKLGGSIIRLGLDNNKEIEVFNDKLYNEIHDNTDLCDGVNPLPGKQSKKDKDKPQTYLPVD